MIKKFFRKYNNYIGESIYFLLIIFITLAMLFSNIYVKFIPILFIFGFVSICVFKKNIITSLIVFITSMLAIYFFNLGDLKYNIIYSTFLWISTFLGEVSGKYFKKSFLLTIFLLIISVFINNYFNGNLYSYLKYSKELDLYLSKNYSSYEVLDSKYINSRYEYLVKINEYVYKVSIHGNNIIEDEFKKEKLDKEVENLNNIYNIKFKDDFKISFSDNDGKIVFNIVNINEEIVLEDYIKDVYSIVNDSDFVEIYKVNISYINKNEIKFATIDKEKLSNFDYYNLAFFDEIIK